MIKAWAFHGQETGALLVAAGSAPPLAVAVHQVVATGPVSYSAQEVAAFGFAFLAVEASSRLVGWGRLFDSRAVLLFLSVTLQAVVAGLGLAWLAFLMLPTLGPGLTGALVVGLCTAGVAVGVRWALPLVSGPQPMTGGILVLGREDLAAKLSRELFQSNLGNGASELVPGSPGSPLGPELEVDPVKLRQLVQSEQISKIVVVEPDSAAREDITSALLECRLLGVDVVDAIDLYQRVKGKIWLEALDPERLVYSDGFRITPTYRFLKRILDVVCALIVLIVASPLIGLIALAIRLESPGCVLFRQERVGQFGKSFMLYKFRSMRVDAETKCGPVWARKNDDRVTRIGGFLRRFHLDEIPQAVNVLRGDLSFVGPRPERPCFVETLREEIPYYHLRHYVKPGVTGWAQVRYPYADSIEDSYEKLQYDLYYAREASLVLDLKILFRTAVHVATAGGR